ncbi:hypothetical protein [Ideonella oryzae]|uniref:Nuclear transport factor 2 family protein n=1 Tax=Ideonella oryzae TaxID=2937441 RepID=A0ABT1BJJ0_9BURK|nr:hypothetical protein [Ideonella oryzae]MCO5975597.1 hypothetical protein [Ideonella oryzae]
MKHAWWWAGMAGLCLSQAGCGFVVVRSARWAYDALTADQRAVEDAASELGRRMKARDPAVTAQMFEAQATWRPGEQPALVGRDAIQDQLRLLAGRWVFECEFAPERTRAQDGVAHQSGRLKTLGDKVTAVGSFDATWHLQTDGSWRLTELVSPSAPALAAACG